MGFCRQVSILSPGICIGKEFWKKGNMDINFPFCFDNTESSSIQFVCVEILHLNYLTKKFNILKVKVDNDMKQPYKLGCVSLLLPRELKLPGPFEQLLLGTMRNLGSNKDIKPQYINSQ